MKTLITTIILLLCTFTTVFAQKYTQKGTTFIDNTSNSTTKRGKSIETKYTWQNKEGKSHKIYLQKNDKEPSMLNALHIYYEFSYNEELDVYVYTFVVPYND